MPTSPPMKCPTSIPWSFFLQMTVATATSCQRSCRERGRERDGQIFSQEPSSLQMGRALTRGGMLGHEKTTWETGSERQEVRDRKWEIGSKSHLPGFQGKISLELPCKMNRTPFIWTDKASFNLWNIWIVFFQQCPFFTCSHENKSIINYMYCTKPLNE